MVQEIMDGSATISDGIDQYILSWRPGRLIGSWEYGLTLHGDESFVIKPIEAALPVE